ncbi:hypothetical protein Pcinc_040211 [Petrolisthes cinctipes]|uniref:Uncharacterized protein n=1 Tax=Petrolisthes cinctipes TaxID=88211 RepID=A0AAE1BM25_PETCI|nr:hypothetical protein Pcinc_040211 [Petrolisthes cinctipes]
MTPATTTEYVFYSRRGKADFHSRQATTTTHNQMSLSSLRGCPYHVTIQQSQRAPYHVTIQQSQRVPLPCDHTTVSEGALPCDHTTVSEGALIM